jgi:hypothetical protein
MRVDWHSFAPAQAHQTNAVGYFGANALQFEDLLMGMPVPLAPCRRQLAGKRRRREFSKPSFRIP